MSDAVKIESDLLEQAAARAARRETPMTAAEEAEFSAWLDASPLHAMALERIDIAWFSLADAANAPELLVMRGEALERSRWLSARRWARATVSTKLRAFAAAAILLFAVAGGGVVWRLTPASYETGIGERQVVALADGSRVSLDATTNVQVRYLGGRRELWLERGRAKFDVAHDPLRPFSVSAAGRTVVATGTSFSVELVNGQMRVIVYEGSVAVLDAARASGNAVDPSGQGAQEPVPALTPGREMVADLAATASVSIRNVDPVRTRAWEAGQLVFDEEPLSLAVARLNRYSSRQITIADGTAARMRVSGVFNTGDTDAFVGAATMLLPLRVERRGQYIVLSAAGR